MLFVLLFAVILSGVAGVSFETCDMCDEFGAEYTVSGLQLCEDCYDLYYDYVYDYDYGYNYNYDYDYDYGYGDRCLDCGTSVPEGRYYCDRCLGYGTCQDCGKSIDSDRLYCDKCLGYGTCQDCGKSIASDRLYCDSCLYD